MPINILRRNHAPSSHPNERIAFIKPLPRPPALRAEHDHADAFLRAVAAQCLPVMKNHHLSVTSLEEYEPNREFIGRNFNNGEVIQLVLRRGDGGGWMGLRQVQMVMIHELAHNLHMNHGGAFWLERNRFAAEMRALWDRGYTGEGFWGSGRSLDTLQSHAGNTVVLGHGRDVEGLCGGTFRSRGRKRKRGARDGGTWLTWREQRDRRIEKKFGKNGVALGEDEDARMRLEIGRRGPLGGRPRVAASKSGRELRAAAALARFDAEKVDEKLKKEEGDSAFESSTEDGDSAADEVGSPEEKAAIDVNGNRLLDSMGFGMTRVSGDEDPDDVNVKQEMEEFDTLKGHLSSKQQKPDRSTQQPKASTSTTDPQVETPWTKTCHASGTHQLLHEQRRLPSVPSHRASPTSSTQASDRTTVARPPGDPAPRVKPAHPFRSTKTTTPPSSTIPCPICTTTNTTLHLTCTACAHVLDRRKDQGAWKCGSTACSGSQYVNAGDCGTCGCCGRVKRRDL